MRDRPSATKINQPDPNVRRILERAELEGIELIRFLYADHGGVIRGKAASRSRLAERLNTGIGHTVAMMAMNMLDQLQEVEHLGPVGEVRIVPDPSTYVPLPHAPGAAAMLSDLRAIDGSPWDACPRTFLKDAIGALAGEGYTLMAAFEPEFTLGRRLPDPSGGPDRLLPIDDSLCYANSGFDTAHDYTIKLIHALETQGLRVEHYHPELGAGQQELSVRHAPALRAADNHVLYRETVRGVAMRMSMWATLAPKPLPDQAGNGAHLHLSLWKDTRNVFAGDDGELECFIGGLIAHLPALTALTCGSVNGFRRLSPRSWAGAYAVHGPDNREAAIRVCSPLGESGEPNLELKPSDSSANPYLSLGAVIHAGLDGLRRKLEPGEAVAIDPDTRPGRYPRLPTSLDEALDALEADELLMEALGPLRRSAYLAVKRSEAEAFSAQDTAYECFHHMRVF
ncbi:glutamine synthetase family protein [Nonomuraea cavernae]|uniref:Glutamine synthetase n=1 Tax=Nonomuraea cavernae TaxID=2045107 RepID=A0A917Z4T3_9ACTN|nr:glutamine synthetase family protein [Nonomuraea cavernae]MCA2188983.1 glutamine synthetase family protein [Nonomuraea cavernae]GGO75352.1 glutamine synthetase [Nonomuraea cavernae]